MRKYSKLFILLLCLLGTCCLTTPVNNTNNQYSTIPVIDVAYKATWDVMGPLNIRPQGAATIIYWEAGHKIIAISALHLFNQPNFTPDTIRYCRMPDESPCTEKKVEVLRKNEDADIVVLIGKAVEKHSGPAAVIAQNEPVLGEVVYAIGTPLGHSRSISRGILSYKNWSEKILRYYTDAVVWFGNSGGGMFNHKGELIGIVIEVKRWPINLGGLLIPGHPVGAFNMASGLPSIHKILQ